MPPCLFPSPGAVGVPIGSQPHVTTRFAGAWQRSTSPVSTVRAEIKEDWLHCGTGSNDCLKRGMKVDMPLHRDLLKLGAASRVLGASANLPDSNSSFTARRVRMDTAHYQPGTWTHLRDDIPFQGRSLAVSSGMRRGSATFSCNGSRTQLRNHLPSFPTFHQ